MTVAGRPQIAELGKPADVRGSLEALRKADHMVAAGGG